MLAETLALYAEKCLEIPTRYIWGGIGEILTEDVMFHKAILYPDIYTEEYICDLLPYLGKGIRVFDCSGLINYFRMGGPCSYRFQEALDWNSQMLFDGAMQKGGIQSLPELRGICLYLKGHVGIYVGDGQVVEATSNPRFGNGVVKTKIDDREWTHWFCCPKVEY